MEYFIHSIQVTWLQNSTQIRSMVWGKEWSLSLLWRRSNWALVGTKWSWEAAWKVTSACEVVSALHLEYLANAWDLGFQLKNHFMDLVWCSRHPQMARGSFLFSRARNRGKEFDNLCLANPDKPQRWNSLHSQEKWVAKSMLVQSLHLSARPLTGCWGGSGKQTSRVAEKMHEEMIRWGRMWLKPQFANWS